MEHRTLLGGLQHLPFARGRVRALRAAGLEFASERLLLPDGIVTVRLIPGHEFIKLEPVGNDYDILSGATKDGELVDLGDPDGVILRNYRPTLDAWTYPLEEDPAKDPAFYNDEPLLAVEAHADLGVTGSQYTDICPGMYSGEMCVIAQLLLGTMKNGTVGQLRYDYRWEKCHGAIYVVDDDYRYWLIEVSRENGVMAMRLPLHSGTGVGTQFFNDAIASGRNSLAFVGTYAGLPSGATFPTGDKLTAAIAAGRVLQLLPAIDMDPFFSKTAYASSCGWSFDSIGTAMNTCYEDVAGVITGYLYKLEITITITDGVASGSAVLTEEESGDLHGESRFNFWEPETGQFVPTPTRAWEASPSAEEQTTAIFVRCVFGDFEKVYHNSTHGRSAGTAWNPGIKWCLSNTVSIYEEDIQTFEWREEYPATTKDSYASSDDYSGRSSGYFERIDISGVSAFDSWQGLDGMGGYYDYEAYSFSFFFIGGTAMSSTGCTVEGTRDGYALRDYAVLSASTIEGTDYMEGAGSGYSRGITRDPAILGPFTFPDGTTGNETGQYNEHFSTSDVPPGPEAAPADINSSSSGELEYLRVRSPLSNMTLSPYYADVFTHMDNDDVWNSTGGSFTLRESYAGDTQTVYSENIDAGTTVICEGDLVDSESPSTSKFSFLGSTAPV